MTERHEKGSHSLPGLLMASTTLMNVKSCWLYFCLFKLFSDPLITYSSAYSIEDLLTPMKTLQIAIRLPEIKCPGCNEWQTTVERSVDYFMKIATPVQIFPPFFAPPRSSIHFAAARYIRNKICLPDITRH